MYDLFGTVPGMEVQNRNNEYEIKGLSYISDFVTNSEHDKLLNLVDSQPWMDDLKRRVQHYGYKYDYKKRKVDHSMKIAELPSWIADYALRLKESGVFKTLPDQVIVNEYLPGQGITNHIDCPPCFSDTIASLSLGADCVMNFTNKDDKNDIIPYLLNNRSLVVLKGDARYNWMHGIKMVKNDSYFGQKIPRRRRISLTFRTVILSE